jgi:hypothetical protein
LPFGECLVQVGRDDESAQGLSQCGHLVHFGFGVRDHEGVIGVLDDEPVLLRGRDGVPAVGAVGGLLNFHGSPDRHGRFGGVSFPDRPAFIIDDLAGLRKQEQNNGDPYDQQAFHFIASFEVG